MAEPSLISNAEWLSDLLVPNVKLGELEISIISGNNLSHLNLNTRPTRVEFVVIDFKLSWATLCGDTRFRRYMAAIRAGDGVI